MSGARCDCGEPLLFVENTATGGRMPLVRTALTNVSREQVKVGMVVVSPSRRKGTVLTLPALIEWSDSLVEAIADGRLHVTHYADCPYANQWSERGSRAQLGLAL